MTTANFLQSYVADVAEHTPLKNLSEADRKLYVPELQRLLEERIGLELIPQLGQEHLAELSNFIAKKDVKPEEWQSFWEKAIPDFSSVIKSILEKCASDVLSILAV